MKIPILAVYNTLAEKTSIWCKMFLKKEKFKNYLKKKKIKNLYVSKLKKSEN